ncbi:Hypothetical protein CINCED_3A020939, partial [Cinara cedri]
MCPLQNVGRKEDCGSLIFNWYWLGEDQDLYAELLEQFFIANYVEEKRKVPVLFAVIVAKP